MCYKMNEINEFIKKYKYNVDRKYLELLWPLYGKENSGWIEITDDMISSFGYKGKGKNIRHIRTNLFRFIQNKFNENQDYKFELSTCKTEKETSNDKKENRGGHNKKTLYMKKKAFKTLLLSVNTYQKDRSIEYFISIETLFHDFYKAKCKNYEHELNQLKQLEHVVKHTREQDDKYRYDASKNIGHVYFIYEENDYSCFKIGFTTKTVIERLKQLQTGNRRKLLIYETIKTYNPKLLEYSIHLFLRKHRIYNSEWFNICCNTLDRLIHNIRNFNVNC